MLPKRSDGRCFDSLLAVAVGAVVLGACGTAPVSPATTPTRASAPARPHQPDIVRACHIDSSDYRQVAEFRCPDGTVPLSGDLRRAQRARLGSIGAGPDGHVLDVYEIPCPQGPQRVTVDAYHCGPGVNAKIDPQNLSPKALLAAAAMIRRMETTPPGKESDQLRAGLLKWLINSPQVHVKLCGDFFTTKMQKSELRGLLTVQLVLSLGAATIEAGPEKRTQAELDLSAVQGVLRLYETVVTTKREVRHPHMERLLVMRKARTLEQYVRENACQKSPK